MSDDSNNNNDDLKVYVYRGKEGEAVPESVEELIVEHGVPEVPVMLCHEYQYLQNVTLPNSGLITIGSFAFDNCRHLLEITIGYTVQFIGYKAFRGCSSLKKVQFESPPSSTYQLQTIGGEAFNRCASIQRIKFPCSVKTVGEGAFAWCDSLVQVDLSTTCITEIARNSFFGCSALQTVSLPNTVEKIENVAFYECVELVAVLVPLGCKPIKVSCLSFDGCHRLANLELPKDSTFDANGSFRGYTVLQEAYGEECPLIVAGLTARFEGFPIHRMCYHQSQITVADLGRCIAELGSVESKILVDIFGMTPFHILFSTIDPSLELLNVLLKSLPNQLLTLQDANGKRPLDYLVKNWTNGAFILAQRTLEKSMLDVLAHWGATSWENDIQTIVQEMLTTDDDESQRASLCCEAYTSMKHYEDLEVTSILEMALWKWKLEFGFANNGSKRQALDIREGCRCLCGSEVVIRPVATFLGIPQGSSSV